MLYQIFNLFFSGYNMFITVENTTKNRAIPPNKYDIRYGKRKNKRVSWSENKSVHIVYSKNEYER